MIGKLFTGEGANAALVVALSGTVAALAARGAGRGSPGGALSGVLSNPVPRRVPAGARVGPGPSGAERRRAA